MPAYFISIDGMDGCGKSTQVKKLTEWFDGQNQPVLSVRDPGGTPLGERLRDILLHRVEIPLTVNAEMLLYMASRSQLVESVIIPALADQCHVISDRYLLSNVVYQGCAGGLDPEQIWNIGHIATQGKMPDLTFVLDLEPEEALTRMGNSLDRLESRGLDYMKKVRQGFLAEGRKLQERLVILDATEPPELIHERITHQVVSRLFASHIA